MFLAIIWTITSFSFISSHFHSFSSFTPKFKSGISNVKSLSIILLLLNLITFMCNWKTMYFYIKLPNKQNQKKQYLLALGVG